MIELKRLEIVPGHRFRLKDEIWVTAKKSFSLAGNLWEGLGKPKRIELLADGKDILALRIGDGIFSRALTHAVGSQSPTFRCRELFNHFPELRANKGYPAEVREIDGKATVLVYITDAGWTKGHPR